MKEFSKGQRVLVVAEDNHCVGRKGRVERVRFAGGAYVELDDPPPEIVRCFSPEDALRSNWVILFPEDCVEEKSS